MMKKFIAALALVSLVAGPTQALATTGSISTSLIKGEVGGNAPDVVVKWEMNGVFTDLSGTDDNPVAGAQFDPTAAYGVDKKFSVCGIVMDPDGVADIDAVYGNIWYPEEIYLGANHEDKRQGCGQELGMECKMTKLSKADGINLFCNNIRVNNNDLPTFADYIAKGYDYLCKADGELNKETAYVACCNRTLSYEDPSGEYETLVSVADKTGNTDILINEFKYQPTVAFETDFDAVNYGEVRLNTEKIINGDLTWNALNQGLSSVRNIGNTRLQMSVNQSDMGLGMTDGVYNVTYKTRVGNELLDWDGWYAPYKTKWINKVLDLSETNEMDFQIKVTKFPAYMGTGFSGSMTLGAKSVDHLLTCDGITDASPDLAS